MPLHEKKCAACGGDLGVTYEVIRGFYSENNVIEEDGNMTLMGPPLFSIRCLDDLEHEWRSEEERGNEIDEWEDRVYKEIKEKFF